MSQDLLTIVVKAAEDGLTLGEVLKIRGFSKRHITRLKHEPKGMCINDQSKTVRALVACGDVITVLRRFAAETTVLPTSLDLRVFWEDDYYLVVDKPAGLPIYPTHLGSRENLASGVLHYLAETGGGGLFHPINRLDRDTSGLVLLAKDAYSCHLAHQNTYQKYYMAVATGHLAASQQIYAPIRKLPERTPYRCAIDPAGKYAHTQVRILAYGPTHTLLYIRLHTGRTHQIRLHMAHVGHPLSGDAIYGERSASGLALHAYKLVFHHPLTGRRVSLNSPEGCQRLVDIVGQ